jgi:DNA-directed RNA polymerase specialized sigma24 family protein
MNQEWVQEYDLLVSTLGMEYSKKYSIVEPSDIKQILWMWFVTHPKKYKEWSELPAKDKEKLIAKSLRNAALAYCEKEKARKFGYDMADLYYYDPSVIEAFLPSILADSYEIPTKIKDLNFQFGKSGEVTDGNNWLVLRSDIEKAFNQLAEAKQNILRLRFTTENCEWSELGKELDTSADGARKRVERAINSLVRILGGWRTFNDTDVVLDKNEDEETDDSGT